MPPDQQSYPKDHGHECPNCHGTGCMTDRDAEGWHFTDCTACQGKGSLPYRKHPTAKEPRHAESSDAAAAEAGSKG